MITLMNIKAKDKTVKELDLIMELTGAPSYSDAIRRAVQAYSYMLDYTKNKNYMLTLKKGWREMEITFPEEDKKD